LIVIPAKARFRVATTGIQLFRIIIKTLDTGSCRRTGETTFYETLEFLKDAYHQWDIKGQEISGS